MGSARPQVSHGRLDYFEIVLMYQRNFLESDDIHVCVNHSSFKTSIEREDICMIKKEGKTLLFSVKKNSKEKKSIQ